jgi:hypothetical protein
MILFGMKMENSGTEEALYNVFDTNERGRYLVVK